MTKSIVIYQSQHGTTKKMAEHIHDFLLENKNESSVYSIDESDNKEISNASVVFLGCWTSGLFLFLQHPERKWMEFAKKLPSLENKKVVLFTTYKLATGSMFKNMKKCLKTGNQDIAILKSKNGLLSNSDKEILKSIL